MIYDFLNTLIVIKWNVVKTNVKLATIMIMYLVFQDPHNNLI